MNNPPVVYAEPLTQIREL